MIGDGACYPKGYRHIADIPVEVALHWIQTVLPDHCLGQGNTPAKDLTPEMLDEPNGWLNKYYVVVAAGNQKYVALYLSDGKCSVIELA